MIPWGCSDATILRFNGVIFTRVHSGSNPAWVEHAWTCLKLQGSSGFLHHFQSFLLWPRLNLCSTAQHNTTRLFLLLRHIFWCLDWCPFFIPASIFRYKSGIISLGMENNFVPVAPPHPPISLFSFVLLSLSLSLKRAHSHNHTHTQQLPFHTARGD